jgi:hypothetical protein
LPRPTKTSLRLAAAIEIIVINRAHRLKIKMADTRRSTCVCSAINSLKVAAAVCVCVQKFRSDGYFHSARHTYLFFLKSICGFECINTRGEMYVKKSAPTFNAAAGGKKLTSSISLIKCLNTFRLICSFQPM